MTPEETLERLAEFYEGNEEIEWAKEANFNAAAIRAVLEKLKDYDLARKRFSPGPLHEAIDDLLLSEHNAKQENERLRAQVGAERYNREDLTQILQARNERLRAQEQKWIALCDKASENATHAEKELKLLQRESDKAISLLIDGKGQLIRENERLQAEIASYENAPAEERIKAVLEENKRLRAEVQSDIEHTAEWHLKWEKVEARIEAALAEIKRVRAVGDHYLEGILARIEKALQGGSDDQ